MLLVPLPKRGRPVWSFAAAVRLGALPYRGTAAQDRADQASATQHATAPVLTHGEIRKVDLQQGKLTIRHGPLENLGMPAMTMVFRANASLLQTIQPGDAVRFAAERVDGVFVVTKIEPAR